MQINYVQFSKLRNLFAPRKPRNPLVRIALGLLGLAILAVLIVAGVFVGAAMILVGLGWKLLASRKARAVRKAEPTWWTPSTAWSARPPCHSRTEHDAAGTLPRCRQSYRSRPVRDLLFVHAGHAVCRRARELIR